MNPRSALMGALVSATVLALAFATETLALGSGPSLAAVQPSTSPSPPGVLPGEPWIVHQWDPSGTGDYGLYLVRPDGSGDHLILTVPGGGYIHPDWSPDGSRLAFATGGYDAIWTADADGSGATTLVTCESPCTLLDTPAWSPDGTHIAFVRADSVNGVWTSGAVEVLDVATGARRTVLESKSPEFFWYPRWSPDGASLVVEMQRYPADQPLPVGDGGPDESGSVIAVADIGGPGIATPRLLTDWDMHAAAPDWNQVDDRIVFSTWDLGYWEKSEQPSNLYTIRPDGTELTQLTHYGQGETRDTQPTWTPDGTRIIFTQVGTDHYSGYRMPREIAFVDADGTNLQVIEGLGATHPRLRPTP